MLLVIGTGGFDSGENEGERMRGMQAGVDVST